MIPETIGLKKLSAHVTPIYKATRRELFLTSSELAALAGTMSGVLEKAMNDLGPVLQMQFALYNIRHRFNRLCAESGDAQEILRDIYDENRSFAKRLA